MAVSAVAFGVVALILAGGFIEWVYWAMREGTIQSHLGHVQVVRQGYLDGGMADPFAYLLPEKVPELEQIAAIKQVQAVAPRLSFNGLISHQESTISFIADGVSPEMEELLSRSLIILEGQGLASSPACPSQISGWLPSSRASATRGFWLRLLTFTLLGSVPM